MSPSVLVAMSGGVDSSVAACLLQEQGYQVLGSHMKLVHLDGVEHGCCGPRRAADAPRSPRIAGFPFEIVDLSATFDRTVMADFVDEHAAGRTPNPCVRCNGEIKFGAFLERADDLGVDLVATGHYVRTLATPTAACTCSAAPTTARTSPTCCTCSGSASCAGPCSPSAACRRPRRARTRGGWACRWPTSPTRRSCASRPAPTTAAFLARARPTSCARGRSSIRAGGCWPHDGTFRFTIGQRRGLGVSTGERPYVVEMDAPSEPRRGRPGELLARRGLGADRARGWPGRRPPPVRSRPRSGSATAATISPPWSRRDGDRIVVEFRPPQRAVAPGQSVVFYRGDEVLGGGRILEAVR